MSLNEVSPGVFSAGRLKTAAELSYQGTKVSRFKFKQRLTSAERIAIRAFATSEDPYAPTVFDFMDLLSEATYIDLSLPETIAGVNLLETLGLIGVGRATIILTTAVTAEEAYNA